MTLPWARVNAVGQLRESLRTFDSRSVVGMDVAVIQNLLTGGRRANRTVGGVRTGQAVGRGRRRDVVMRSRPRACRAMVGPDSHTLAFKIGRASCREREKTEEVCGAS